MPRIVVVGAGAAGTMAAIFAASKGADTLLVERTKDGGRKILISGGGRCNILPARLDESRFVSDSSPHLVRRIVRSWPLHEQISFFEGELGLPLVEEFESGKLFPRSQSARDVRDTLLTHARRNGVTILTGTLVTGIERSGDRWIVQRHEGERFEADAVVLATGGLSVPNTGSDGRGLKMAEALGHVVNPTYAALTPLTAGLPAARSTQVSFGETILSAADGAPHLPFAHLSGVSVPVTITARSATRQAQATGGFLFTHHGYSGPSVLDVSHVAVRSQSEPETPARITVQWTPLRDGDWENIFRLPGTRTVLAAVTSELPNRLADALVAAARVDPSRQLAQLGRGERLRLIDTLVRGELPWTGDEGYKKAEVTGGGVSLADIDPRTLESRRHSGLFLCGEMLDAFGPIGGYNFLWAWATGRAAGIGAADCLG
jgi:predicted Rossmann fold flavoprotein